MLLGNNLNFGRNEAQNVVVQNLASAPSSPVNGLIYYDTTLNKFGSYQNGSWVYLSGTVANGVTKATNASGAGVLQVSGGADKTIADYSGSSGLIKVSSGVASTATAGTDYVSPTGSETITNKTINASSNTITNLTTAMFATNVIDTDTTLAANSDTRVSSQKAVKAYIDGIALSGMHFKGTVDASTNPNYPAATVGDMYKISVAGKIGGGSGTSVTAGDAIVCITTAIAGDEATVGTSWDVIQANVDAATTSTQGLVTLATSTEAEAKSNTAKVLTPSAVVNFPVKKAFTIGDGSTTAIVVTHNLGTKDIVASVRDASTDALILVDIAATSTNTATITFATAPASNAYKLVIIG